MKQKDRIVLRSVVHWFEKSVLGLNLCPFAYKPYDAGTVRFEVSVAQDDEACLIDLYLQLVRLDQHAEIETIVLVCPWLADFHHYLQFLQMGQELLEQEGWEGVYQIASFHPDYRFRGTSKHDRENWTNRSPYPLLHLIREESVSRAVEMIDDIDRVAQRNIHTVKGLSDESMREIFGRRYRVEHEACLAGDAPGRLKNKKSR